MVKDHLDSERGNLLLPHGLLFPISSKGSFICTIPHRIAHTTACYTNRGALAGPRNSSIQTCYGMELVQGKSHSADKARAKHLRNKFQGPQDMQPLLN